MSQSLGTACLPCPAKSVSPPASTSVDQCVCEQGHFNNVDELRPGDEPTCTPCRVGTVCSLPGTALQTLAIQIGHWRVSNTSIDVRRCPECAAAPGSRRPP